MNVSLFIPCLVDRFLPEVGQATARVLEAAGHELRFDARQTCCGQPAWNAGHVTEAASLARRFLDIFEGAEAVVAPSGSCVSMVVNHYGDLPLSDRDLGRWAELRERVFELGQFLGKEPEKVDISWPGRVAVHYTCHFLRELDGAAEALPTLLDRVRDLEWFELEDARTCCGFGGTFSSKLHEVSLDMGQGRLDALEASGADTLLLADAGCILHLRGILEARGLSARYRILHYAQVLAGGDP